MPSVCIVVVSEDNERLLGPCLTALLAQTRPPDELIVVDNASSDRGPELVRTEFPEVRLMALNQSAGIAPAVNLAFDETSADLIGVVLPQVVVDSEWLGSLLEHVCKEWDSWASKLTLGDALHSCGVAMTVVGRAVRVGHGQPAHSTSTPQEVFGCCYPATLYRRSLLVDVLGFDSDFFVEADDIDVAFRARLRGHRCLFVPQATGRLREPEGRVTAQRVFFRERNTAFVFWQNMPVSLLLLYLPERLIYQVGAFVSRLISLRGLSYLRAKLHVARNLGKMLKKRSRVQTGRLLTARQLRRCLSRNWWRRS